MRAQERILGELGRIAPGVPALAEESAAAFGEVAAEAPFFLVDPLDGAKEHLAGRTSFTVNIALVENRAEELSRA